MTIAAVLPGRAWAFPPDAAVAQSKRINTSCGWCGANPNLETVDEDLTRLERCMGPVGCILACKAHIDEILTWYARVWRLVAMDHFPKLSHGARDANTTVLGHDARCDPHKCRHG